MGAYIHLGYDEDWCKDDDTVANHGLPHLTEVATPLGCAAAVGSAELASLLIDSGADANETFDNGKTALHIATGGAVATLLASGANVNTADQWGWTPLVFAVSRQDVETVIKLLDAGADADSKRTTRYRIQVPVEATPANGTLEEKLVVGTSSPLMVVCGHGRLKDTSAEFIKLLSNAGADVNRLYSAGEDPCVQFTALSIICASRTMLPMTRASHADNDVFGENEVSSVRVLIKSGADVNTPAVLPHVCDGTMPFTDFQYRLSSLKLLLAGGSGPGSALDGLVRSYTDDDASQKQFIEMAGELFKAGATWSDLKADITDEKLQSLKVLLARA